MVDEEDIIKIGKEIIPNIYDDGAKPAIKEMGNFIARPLKLINTLFQPLDVWLLNKEYNLEKTKVLLAERLKHVAENELCLNKISKSIEYGLNASAKDFDGIHKYLISNTTY